MLSIAVTIYIINKPGNPSIKLAWIIPILLFPVFGGLLYLAFGKSKVQEPLKSRIRDAVVESRRILVQDENALAQLRQTDALAFRQSCYIQSHSLFPLYRQTSARYLTPGEEKFKALLQKLKEARHFIFLEYFIIHEGKMWSRAGNFAAKGKRRRRSARNVRRCWLYQHPARQILRNLAQNGHQSAGV